MTRAPVYFISHGGPPSMFDQNGGPYQAWKRVGKMIRQDIDAGKIDREKGLVCVSAHWESTDMTGKTIEINTNESNPLIYDFYNFPKHFYAQTFKSNSTKQAATDVKNVLTTAGWRVKEVARGLDHGLWVPFKVAFKQEAAQSMTPPAATESALQDTPRIIQLSLPGDMSEASSEKLGMTLGKLRDQGYAIVATGQAVHNLRDLQHIRAMGGKGTPYGPPFLAAVMYAIKSPVNEIGQTTKGLFSHPQYKRAHPTAEHLLPLVVSAGAVQGGHDGGRAEVIFEEEDGPLGWAMARWD